MGTYLLLAAALAAVAAQQPQAEDCVAGWSDGQGAPQTTVVAVNWEGRLDRSGFPQAMSGIGCPRAAIVPRPDDIRVLTELGVSFGVVDPSGRALWVWARGGRLEIELEGGELSAAEREAVEAWRSGAQARFDAALAAR